MNGESSNGKQIQTVDRETISKLVTSGDTSGLTPEQRLQYYRARCEAAGLDYRTAPFQFLKLQGREVLYAKKEVTDQLASKHKIKCEIMSQVNDNGMRVVTVRATAADGRQTDEIGAVAIDGLRGADLPNAYMKAVTKAKRRAILSVCGLGVTDESELDTMPHAEKIEVNPETGEIKEVPGADKILKAFPGKIMDLPPAGPVVTPEVVKAPEPPRPYQKPPASKNQSPWSVMSDKIVDVKQTPGVGPKGPWLRSQIVTAGGTKLVTFDRPMGDKAISAMRMGKVATMGYAQPSNPKFALDLKSIDFSVLTEADSDTKEEPPSEEVPF